jgi:secondary thiamine-phosphate synthase enzyme
VDITKQVSEAINESGIEEGVAIVFCPHTTAAITITENTDHENVGKDTLLTLSEAFPKDTRHMHREGNSFAHIKSSVMQCEINLIVTGGWPLLGAWQALFFCEFDGPRERRYYVKVVGDRPDVPVERVTDDELYDEFQDGVEY